MRRKVITTFALALLGIASACRAGAHRGAPQPEDVTVNVVNENFYDARIHAVFVGGQRRSLGTVAGNGGRSTMAVDWEPRSLVFEIVFVIDGAAWVSHSVEVSPGESIDVSIPQNIAASGFFRRMGRR